MGRIMTVYCVVNGELRSYLDHVMYASTSKDDAETFAYEFGFYDLQGDACIETLNVTVREENPDPIKPDITDYVKLLDSLPAERKKELEILYDHWFKKIFGVDPETFKKKED